MALVNAIPYRLVKRFPVQVYVAVSGGQWMAGSIRQGIPMLGNANTPLFRYCPNGTSHRDASTLAIVVRLAECAELRS